MITSCRSIALAFGYVEGNTIPWLIYNVEGKVPATREEALCSLAEYLYQKWKCEAYGNEKYCNTYKAHMSFCCREHWTHRDRNVPLANCPKCNAIYSDAYVCAFTFESWQQYLIDLNKSDYDSYGEHEDVENKYGWNPFHFGFDVPSNQILVINENAEYILALALLKKYPELKEVLFDKDFNENNIFSLNIFTDESKVYCSASKRYISPDKLKKVITTIENDDGSKYTTINGVYQSITYNTGDTITLACHDGKYFVTKIVTYNGVVREYS